jgi:hypothetical protein
MGLFATAMLVVAIILAGCGASPALEPAAEDVSDENAQAVTPGALTVEWQGDAGCRQASVDRNENVRFGACGGSLTTLQLGEAADEAGSELATFVATYAPFTATTAAGTVSFGGQGEQVASAAEQRMLAEWARWLAREAEAGVTTISDGVVFTWHRVGGAKAACDIVSLYVTGVAETRSCHQEPPVLLSRTRLNADQLARLYEWADSLAAIEDGEASVDSDGASIRLAFNGLGATATNQSAQQAMIDLAESLFNAAGQASDNP